MSIVKVFHSCSSRERIAAWRENGNGIYADIYETYDKGCYAETIELLNKYDDNGNSKGSSNDKSGTTKNSTNGNNRTNNGSKAVNPLVHIKKVHLRLTLIRALCYQQEREFSRVVIITNEIIRTISSENQQCRTADTAVCHIVSLWLRAIAYEELGKWSLALKDLKQLKTLIHSNYRTLFQCDGLLLLFFKNVPLVAPQPLEDAIKFNLHCVTDRLRRISTFLAKEESRRSDLSQVFKLIDEDNDNYYELAKVFHYRLCLKRPIHPCIHLNMWYTMDLMLVSEMGLFKKEDMEGIEGFALSCKILTIGPEDYFYQLDVEVRSLNEEACEWSGLTNIEWAGIRGGKGGLEFRVVATNSVGDNELCSHHRWYLHVYPTAEVVHNSGSGGDPVEYTQRDIVDHRLVSLVVGPIELVQCYQYPSSCIHHQLFANGFRDDAACMDDSLSNSSLEYSSSCSSPSSFYSSPSPESLVSISTTSNQSSWTSETYLVNNHRAFSLPRNKTLVVQELWDAGIPGKVWDSAFIVAQYMRDCFLKDESVLFGKRILDLSTGTGFVGLYLAALCGVISKGKTVKEMKQTTVLLTDLEPAIDLIKKNQSLNHYLFKGVKVSTEIEVLNWGDVSRARRLGPFDIVLASDVIYEPEFFDALIQTLVTVCTPNRTQIYIGYKRRGLSPQEEEGFFLKLAEEFKVTLVEGVGKAADEQKVKICKLTR